ncbi:GNAT family N-acetyltransferase [Candidatus Gracilibacteria bacterium]|nr:GNAT family N-acetyltransferase [Candidatus Gracilibacteria bacterium]
MQLVKPNRKYEKSWKEVLSELETEGLMGFFNPNPLEKTRDLDHYIKQTKDCEEGKNLPEDWVSSTTYWLVDNNKLIGQVNIRHKLTDSLKKLGGHIGYVIRPTARKMSYGTKILELALQKAESLGLKKVLITCDESNTASQKIIEKNKGVFQDKISGKDEPTLRYWIDL